ncbi:MAG: DNA gyrase inhibitor YacG [Rhodobacteraceae bacterium]|nr:DNA gyrase inhibitor YacG [Paracoccaceae bacterium]
MSCPICANDTDKRYRPFCSRRCADVDLAKWMSGSYIIPGPPDDSEEAALEAYEAEIEAGSKKPH